MMMMLMKFVVMMVAVVAIMVVVMVIAFGGAYLLVALVLLETLEQGEESLERRPAKLIKVDHSFGNRVFDILATASYRQ